MLRKIFQPGPTNYGTKFDTSEMESPAKWLQISGLSRAFDKVIESPNHHHTSFREFRLWHQAPRAWIFYKDLSRAPEYLPKRGP